MTRAVPAALVVDLTRRVLEQEARIRFRVWGESMRPTLRSGDHVTLAPIRQRPPCRGDLVALSTDDGLMIHRYLGRRPDGKILTAGDNVAYRDAPSPEEALIGVVEEIDRDGRPPRRWGNRIALWIAEARRVLPALRRRCHELIRRRLHG